MKNVTKTGENYCATGKRRQKRGYVSQLVQYLFNTHYVGTYYR